MLGEHEKAIFSWCITLMQAGILRAGAEVTSKKRGGGGPTTYSGQFVFKKGGAPPLHGSAPTMLPCTYFTQGTQCVLGNPNPFGQVEKGTWYR